MGGLFHNSSSPLEHRSVGAVEKARGPAKRAAALATRAKKAVMSRITTAGLFGKTQARLHGVCDIRVLFVRHFRMTLGSESVEAG